MTRQSATGHSTRTYLRILGLCLVLCGSLLGQGQETISTPAAPSGQASALTGALLQYSASGSTSSLGHAIQYSFDWGDGSHSGWTPPSVTSSFHTWSTPGTYTVTVQARCTLDTTIVSSSSPSLVVTLSGESISAPSTPAGSSTALTGAATTYSTGNAASSVGHSVRYRLFWGDGSYTAWLPTGTTTASHSWPGPGTYSVTAQARCATDTQVVSPASDAWTVMVTSAETISTPTPPNGPAAGSSGVSYSYSTGGATSSSGSSLSYLFDWGDGQTSGWLPAGTTSASHSWTANGTYSVTALAADAGALLIRSNPSNGLTVTITPPPPTITSVSPQTGAAGTKFTILGSALGATRGSGAVWLGTTYATVVSWSDTQVVATVASNSTTGTALVRQGGVWSNSLDFAINSATISGVNPSSGIPGTAVTITGSGFGSAQGAGQVWLATASGVVQSWSDTQVVSPWWAPGLPPAIPACCKVASSARGRGSPSTRLN